MKKLNIIPALSYKEQYELCYWFWITTFLVAGVFIGACCFVIPLLYEYNSLKSKNYLLRQKTSRYAELINTKNSAQKQYETQQAKERKIDKYSPSANSIHSYLAMIQKAISAQLQLYSIECKKNELMIHVIGDSTKDIQILVEQLAVCDKFKHITLNSLEKKQSNKWLCVIKIQI
jgi:Tfp pilus assembly protein PilN